MSKTCALCRERGVNCDGLQPTCRQCAEFGASVPCDYSSRAAGPSFRSSNLLQKGAACLPCRKKKKRCDAKRPCCTTCKTANKQAHCVYEDDAQRNLIQSLVARTRELEERLASAEQSPRNSPPLQNQPVPSFEDTSARIASGRIATGSEWFNTLPAWKPPVADVPLRDLSPHTTPEHFRDFRLRFLAFSAHFGIKLLPEASNAIAKGDFYSPHVHPAPIHAAQLLGCMMWQELNHTTSLATMERFELETTISLVTDDTPQLVVLQVYNCLAVYYFTRRMYSEGTEQVRVASDYVRRQGMRFISLSTDVWDPLLEPSRETEGLICALSHLLYLNIDRHLVLGVPSDLGPDYEQEFHSIPLMYPALSRSYLSVLRSRGGLLLRRTLQLSARLQTLCTSPWPRNGQLGATGGCTEQPWLAEYWALLEEVEMNLASVNPAQLKASMHPEQCASAHGLKICLVVTLTAEAELHHLAPRQHVESRQHCLNAVLKLIGIIKTLMASDYEMLDPILGVCWLTIAKVMFEESAHPMDDLSAMNWVTARSVIVACVPVLAKALPYLEAPLNQILEKAAAKVMPAS